MNILTVIPARAGSKGVPGKNLRPLGGVPLLARAIRTALASKHSSTIVVTTDSQEMATIAKAEGASVPFLRPASLADDKTPVPPVILNALEFMESEGATFDIVVALQPTNPLLSTETFDQVLDRILLENDLDSVVTTTLIRKGHPFRAYAIDQDKHLKPLTEYTTEKYLQKQDRPDAFQMTGGLIARRSQTLRKNRAAGFALGDTIGAIEVDEFESIDIDSEIDLLFAEAVLNFKSNTGNG